MKKITLLMCITLLSFVVTLAQIDDNKIGNPSVKGSKGAATGWDLLFSHDISNSPATNQAGVETDGSFFYVTKWNGPKIWKYDMNGNFVDSITIPGVSGLRDLAYDGTYFYGGITTNLIYQMDFTNKTLVSTITAPTVTEVRHIAYDPINDAFWVGNFSSDMWLISKTGTLLNTITATAHGQTSTYGSAFDTLTAGGPYLWVINAVSSSPPIISQIDIAAKQSTGLYYDVKYDIPASTGIGGGLFTHPDTGTGKVILGGIIQNEYIFGYDLASTVPKDYDVTMKYLFTPSYMMTNVADSIIGEVQNNGSVAITSLDINWRVNKGTVHTQNLTGLNIGQYSTYYFGHTDLYTPQIAGTDTLEVWTSNPNGNTDPSPGNDSMVKLIEVVDTFVQRIVLHEIFTSSTCGPCVAFNTWFDGTFFPTIPDKYTLIKYQMNWPSTGDPYYTAEGGTRKNYYGTVTGVPKAFIEGDEMPADYGTIRFNERYDTPSFIGIEATHSITGTTIDVDVTITPIDDITGVFRAHIVVVENTTTGNVGTNGETEFHSVMMKMLPSANGTTINSFTKGTPVQINQTYNLSSTHVEEYTDLSVVVFVQNYATKKVYQSAYSVNLAGINEKDADNGIIGLFPNPANSKAFVKYLLSDKKDVSINMYNILGELVYSKDEGVLSSGNYTSEINVTDMPDGIYIFKLNIGDKVFTKKINVSK